MSSFSLESLMQPDLLSRLGPALVGLVIAGSMWLFANRLMSTWKRERLERLRKLEGFVAVPTSSPYDNLEEKARRDAETNVQVRFSVMKTVLFVSLGSLVFVMAALPFLGKLPQTLLSFLVAAAITIVGVAARPLIENFISGLVLSFSKQLRVGDTVLLDADHYGTIEDINPTHTVVKLWDWRRYVVPNASMLQKEIVSYCHKDNFLWTHVPFHVSPQADITIVEKIAVESAAQSRHVADFEDPQFWVRELLAGSTLCWIAAWARNPEDAWYLRADIRKNLSVRLREAKVDTQLATHQMLGEQAKAVPPPRG